MFSPKWSLPMRRRFSQFLQIIAITWPLAAWMMSAQAADPVIDFNRDIRPILSNICFKCHGPDEKEVQAGLRLDSRAGAVAKLESGKVAVGPGKLEESELFRRVTAENLDERMPPAGSGKKLEPRDIELLRVWI